MTAVNSSLPADMLAVRVEEFGGLDAIRLARLPLPVPKAGEVLVEVGAAGVGPWDAWVRSGKSRLPQPLPLTLGAELSGIVVAAGPDPGGLAIGEAVFGVTNPRFVGAHAEYTIAEVRSLAQKPEWLSFVDAAAVPVAAVTAWSMLFDLGALALGQRVLVHGAAGNVGRYAVQMAKGAGAFVIATCFREDVAAVHALGADSVIDVSAAPFMGQVKYADLVIDTVGGVTQAASFDVLVPGGRLVSSVAPPDEALARQRHVTAAFFIVEVTSERLNRVLSLIKLDKLTIAVGEILPLRDVARAHAMLAGGPHRPGKIILLPRSEGSPSPEPD
jgi:NADPH:quinone reductase-like Zn-dependent oxidoreductase